MLLIVIGLFFLIMKNYWDYIQKQEILELIKKFIDDKK
jgi:hypothetical protein